MRKFRVRKHMTPALSLSFSSFLLCAPAGAQDLPPAMLADQYLLEATEAMEQGRAPKGGTGVPEDRGPGDRAAAAVCVFLRQATGGTWRRTGGVAQGPSVPQTVRHQCWSRVGVLSPRL